MIDAVFFNCGDPPTARRCLGRAISQKHASSAPRDLDKTARTIGLGVLFGAIRSCRSTGKRSRPSYHPHRRVGRDEALALGGGRKPLDLVDNITALAVKAGDQVADLFLGHHRQGTAQWRRLQFGRGNTVDRLQFRRGADLVVAPDDIDPVALRDDLGQADPSGTGGT